MINNKRCAGIERLVNVMKTLESIESSGHAFKQKELSQSFLKGFLNREKLKKALKNYIDILPESIRSVIYKEGFNGFVEDFYSAIIYSVPIMVLQLEILGSGVMEQAKLDLGTYQTLGFLKESMEDYIENDIRYVNYSTEHIDINPFEFYIFINKHISKFNVASENVYDSKSMKVFLDIFGDKMVPTSLYKDLLDKDSTNRDYILDYNSRIDDYSNYEVNRVDFSKNSLELNDIKLIVNDGSGCCNHDYCFASYSYVYSKSIDNFIKGSSKKDISKLLNSIENLYKYRDLDRTTCTKPIIVKKGDLLYDRFKCPEDVENYIVMGEFYWIYSERFSFSNLENLMHTKYYLEEINKMLEGY